MNSESHLPILWFCVSYLPFLLLGLLICKVGRGHQVSQSCDSQWGDKGFSVCQERIPKDVGFFFAVLEESPVTGLNCLLVQRTSAKVPVYTVGRQVDHWVGGDTSKLQITEASGQQLSTKPEYWGYQMWRAGFEETVSVTAWVQRNCLWIQSTRTRKSREIYAAKLLWFP